MIADRYNEAVGWLFSQLPVFEKQGSSAYKPGLERVERLAGARSHPEKSIPKIIHVAGTNGKGSTSHTLASILQSQGYRVGLFTSPHLLDFRERIRVSGQMVSKDFVVDFVDRFKSLDIDINPSFFELTTVMAFSYFAEAQVDIAVVEVGLGGRLDSTNIVTPILSVITNISLDHTSLLGNTRAEIAREKAGIIKRHVPVVIGESDQEIAPVFQEVANFVDSPVYFAQNSDQLIKSEVGKDHNIYFTKDFGYFFGELTGECQQRNARTILSCVDCLNDLGLNIGREAVVRGFGSVVELTGICGRWTIIKEDPLVICDTGHNPGGWHYLIERIKELPGKKHLVLGFVNDKDVCSILAMLERSVPDAKYYFSAPGCHRALPPIELLIMARDSGLDGEMFEKVALGYEKALADCDKGDSIFVGGSNYVVAEFLESVTLKQ